ncbi:MAG: hypothetical protein VR71_11060 [Roseovarius sp. BRH_c41]|nr:MAG: hypothetical protein VR71_11060 [Roseovarius sp. BRH_c41]
MANMQGCGFMLRCSVLCFQHRKYGDNAMAYPAKKPVNPVPSPKAETPDWVAVYYSPEAPANQSTAPGVDALEQVYAYYDA